MKIFPMRHFSNEFIHELESALSRFSQISFGTSKSFVDNIFEKHASVKKEICPGKSSFIRK